MKTSFEKRNIFSKLFPAISATILLVMAIIGLFSIWLLMNQLDQQAWSQVNQGQRAASALHGAQYREIFNLATMIGQRPTLRKLLIEGDIPSLLNYLHTIKDNAGLTRVIVCDQQNHIIATTDDAVPESICTQWRRGNYQFNPEIPQACLTAHHPIEDDSGNVLGEVFVCNQLDDAFARQISLGTGLEHTIWIGDVPVSTSFDVKASELVSYPHSIIMQNGRLSHHTFEIDGTPYYSASIPLENSRLKAEVALDVHEIKNSGALFTKIFAIIILF